MSKWHIWEHIGWLWNDAMNNHTAFAKASNAWTQLEHSMCGRRATWSPLLWWPCYCWHQRVVFWKVNSPLFKSFISVLIGETTSAQTENVFASSAVVGEWRHSGCQGDVTVAGRQRPSPVGCSPRVVSHSPIGASGGRSRDTRGDGSVDTIRMVSNGGAGLSNL